MRLSIVACLFLLLGFAFGWFLKPAPTAPAFREADPSAVPAPPATATSAPVIPASTGPADRLAQVNDEIRAHRRALQELQKANRGGFRLGGRTERIDPGLAEYLRLSPEETATINAALLAAGQAIQSAQLKGASIKLSADNATCLIDVPGIDTATSGAEFDRLMEVLRTTMGSERLALFNELVGARFEHLYDNFGLKTLRYEIATQPVIATGLPPLLQYQRHDRGPTALDRGTLGSTIPLAQMEKSDPLLFQLLPSAIRQTLSP